MLCSNHRQRIENLGIMQIIRVMSIIKVLGLIGIQIKSDGLSIRIKIRNGRETTKISELIMINPTRLRKSPMRNMKDLIICPPKKKSNHKSRLPDLKKEEL